MADTKKQIEQQQEGEDEKNAVCLLRFESELDDWLWSEVARRRLDNRQDVIKVILREAKSKSDHATA